MQKFQVRSKSMHLTFPGPPYGSTRGSNDPDQCFASELVRAHVPEQSSKGHIQTRSDK